MSKEFMEGSVDFELSESNVLGLSQTLDKNKPQQIKIDDANLEDSELSSMDSLDDNYEELKGEKEKLEKLSMSYYFLHLEYSLGINFNYMILL